MGFSPAVSNDAAKSFRKKIKEVFRRNKTTNIMLLAKELNPIIRGWYNYFGVFCPSEAFRKGINYVNLILVRWLKRTRKKVKRAYKKAQHLLFNIAMTNREMFYHWKVGYLPVK